MYDFIINRIAHWYNICGIGSLNVDELRDVIRFSRGLVFYVFDEILCRLSLDDWNYARKILLRILEYEVEIVKSPLNSDYGAVGKLYLWNILHLDLL